MAEFPPNIGSPATRAITRAGIVSLTDLAGWSEAELGELHGVGPKAVAILGDALDEAGKAFATDTRASDTAEVDAYLDAAPSPQRETLRTVRATLLELLPHGRDAMSYSMPAVQLDGISVAGYSANKNHCGYYAHSGSTTQAAGERLDAYVTTRSGIHFDVDTPLPKSVLRLMVSLKLAELGAVDRGIRSEYYPDGQLKAQGRMKDGKPSGRWKWFDKDGSLKRGRHLPGRRADRHPDQLRQRRQPHRHDHLLIEMLELTVDRPVPGASSR
jgi:uncharacterized protein YdhG (YjbR/CyaY superfamily)